MRRVASPCALFLRPPASKCFLPPVDMGGSLRSHLCCTPSSTGCRPRHLQSLYTFVRFMGSVQGTARAPTTATGHPVKGSWCLCSSTRQGPVPTEEIKGVQTVYLSTKGDGSSTYPWCEPQALPTPALCLQGVCKTLCRGSSCATVQVFSAGEQHRRFLRFT